MHLFPAIDIFDGKAVRLFKGNYDQMTVYNEHPENIAIDFKNSGAKHIHIVDLQGAKTGNTPNFETVCKIKNTTDLFCEIGGGIRSMDVIDKYVSAGLDRIILGTSAIEDPTLLKESIQKYNDKIAVGVDIRDGFVAIKGWTEKSTVDAFDFCHTLENIGVMTIIVTDISKDGAMSGTNRTLYQNLKNEFKMNITASGGVTNLDDIIALNKLNIYGTIIGKAYYTGAINLKEAVEAITC